MRRPTRLAIATAILTLASSTTTFGTISGGGFGRIRTSAPWSPELLILPDGLAVNGTVTQFATYYGLVGTRMDAGYQTSMSGSPVPPKPGRPPDLVPMAYAIRLRGDIFVDQSSYNDPNLRVDAQLTGRVSDQFAFVTPLAHDDAAGGTYRLMWHLSAQTTTAGPGTINRVQYEVGSGSFFVAETLDVSVSAVEMDIVTPPLPFTFDVQKSLYGKIETHAESAPPLAGTGSATGLFQLSFIGIYDVRDNSGELMPASSWSARSIRVLPVAPEPGGVALLICPVAVRILGGVVEIA